MVTKAPESYATGVIWPGIPRPADAVMFAVLFQMEQSQWWPSELIRTYQFRQIQALVDHAVKHVPLYRDRLRSVAGLPVGELTEEAWREVPILRRAEIQEAGAAFYADEIPKAHGERTDSWTSGSTGRPIKSQKTALTHLFRRAVDLRGHIWHGRDLSKKMAVLRRLKERPKNDTHVSWAAGYTTGPVALRDIAGRTDDHLDWLAKENPHYFVTYPTNALAMGVRAKERGMLFPNLCGINTMGEVLTRDDRARCHELWGVPVVDVYSAQEADDLALQCPEHDHYLVQAECVFMEILDENNQPCEPGQIGRVVLTVLHNFATPLIRYEIGDFAEMGGPCPSGRGLPVLNQIIGRVRNMVMTPEGDRRYVRINGGELTKIAPLRQIQFRQRVPEEIELLAVVVQPLNQEEQKHLRETAMQALGYPFTLSITYVDEIPRLPGGKYEDVHSELTA